MQSHAKKRPISSDFGVDVDVDVNIVADAGDTDNNAVVVVIICDFESGDTKEVALEMGESNVSV